MAIDLGNGTTLVLASTSLSAEKLNVSGSSNFAVDKIPSTHLGTTTAKTYVPGDLYDGGEFNMEIHWLGDVAPTTHVRIIQTITIDWGGSGKTWAFTGYIDEWTPTASLHEKMTAAVKITVAGAITEVTA
jgi:hypothetical protein